MAKCVTPPITDDSVHRIQRAGADAKGPDFVHVIERPEETDSVLNILSLFSWIVVVSWLGDAFPCVLKSNANAMKPACATTVELHGLGFRWRPQGDTFIYRS